MYRDKRDSYRFNISLLIVIMSIGTAPRRRIDENQKSGKNDDSTDQFVGGDWRRCTSSSRSKSSAIKSSASRIMSATESLAISGDGGAGEGLGRRGYAPGHPVKGLAGADPDVA